MDLLTPSSPGGLPTYVFDQFVDAGCFVNELVYLQNEILQLSERYVRSLSRESRDVIDGPYAGRLTGYGMY